MIVCLCSRFAQENFHNYQDLLINREDKTNTVYFAQNLLGDF